MNLIGIQQNIWSIKIGIFLSYTLWLKIVSGTSTHGNYDCPKWFFFPTFISYLFQILSPKNKWCYCPAKLCHGFCGGRYWLETCDSSRCTILVCSQNILLPVNWNYHYFTHLSDFPAEQLPQLWLHQFCCPQSSVDELLCPLLGFILSYSHCQLKCSCFSRTAAESS